MRVLERVILSAGIAMLWVGLTACSQRLKLHSAPGHVGANQRTAATVRIDEVLENIWGIGTLSVSSGRETPEHKSEMGTQVLMGEVVRVLKRANHWYQVQTLDGYLCWLEKGTVRLCNAEEVRRWTNSPLLIVTAIEHTVRSLPEERAEPVSDVVIADLVKFLDNTGGWVRVELPDGRGGWLPKTSVEDYALWRSYRQPTRENIQSTARQFLGRPYLWGGNSPKGLDCSGFTKLVFFLNGIELRRNASQQAQQGIEVVIDADFSELQTGDLMFFGRRTGEGKPDVVTHVGIYLENKLMIHSSGLVRINSLDPNSPIRDEPRIQRLLFARRLPLRRS